MFSRYFYLFLVELKKNKILTRVRSGFLRFKVYLTSSFCCFQIKQHALKPRIHQTNISKIQRFRLVGTIASPYSFERISFVERENAKMCKSINLATLPNSSIIYDFGCDRDRFNLIAREYNKIEIHGTTGPVKSHYEGWVHIVIDNGMGFLTIFVHLQKT